jgi:urea carboxylase-associated protein 2
MTRIVRGAQPHLWSEVLQHGAHWSGVARRGTTLRITAAEDGANVSATFFNYEALTERYNMPDTLKAQHIAYLTAGCVCYSDMGRVLCSITADTCGWHDPICGLSDSDLVAAKYGATRFQEQRNDFHKNGRDSMLGELSKYGLGPRDLHSVIHFFSRVTAADDGTLAFQPGNCRAGQHVDLRFEMHSLVVLSTCQHPLDPQPRYWPRSVQLSAWVTGPAPEVDACRDRCRENSRGLRNTEMMFLA